MELAAIPEIGVESVGEEVTYRLPARPLGILRLAALVPIGFSAVWCGFIGAIAVPQFRHLANHPQPFDFFLCAFLLCFMAAGCVPAGLGLVLLFGRCRIRWRDERLTVSDRLGPFGWSRRLPRQPIRKFVVIGGGTVEGYRTLPGPFATLAVLSASFENGVSRTVVSGYPRPWLEALAQDLSARAGLEQATAPPVELYQGLAKELASEVTQKPAGSPVVLERREASVVLAVPPAGLWKGSMGFAFFAILWCLFTGAFTAAFLFAGKFELAMVPFIAMFWLVGLGMLAVAINLGMRRATFTAGHDELTVVKSGPFGTKRLQFRRAEIANVSAGASNVSVNHRPVPELQVRLVTGKKFGFLVGRDPDELRWIATELSNALGLAAPAQAAAPGPMGWPYAGAGARQVGTPLGKFLGVVVFAGIVIAMFWGPIAGFLAPIHAHHATRAPTANPVLSNKPVAGDPMLVFNAFGPSRTYRATNAWAVGREAHAEWFVPTRSGTLSEIEVAVEPDDGNPHPGKATIFLARNRNGFPGHTLESFSVSAEEATGLLRLESAKKPELQGGVKYWLCARSQGGWSWHFNDQNVIHNTAREVKRGKWASAGDYCYVGAFSIRVSTNPPPAELAQPAEDDPKNSDPK